MEKPDKNSTAYHDTTFVDGQTRYTTDLEKYIDYLLSKPVSDSFIKHMKSLVEFHEKLEQSHAKGDRFTLSDRSYRKAQTIKELINSAEILNK